MRYDHVVFAQPALEKLQDSLRRRLRRAHEVEAAPEKAKKTKPAGRARKAKAQTAKAQTTTRTKTPVEVA